MREFYKFTVVEFSALPIGFITVSGFPEICTNNLIWQVCSKSSKCFLKNYLYVSLISDICLS